MNAKLVYPKLNRTYPGKVVVYLMTSDNEDACVSQSYGLPGIGDTKEEAIRNAFAYLDEAVRLLKIEACKEGVDL